MLYEIADSCPEATISFNTVYYFHPLTFDPVGHWASDFINDNSQVTTLFLFIMAELFVF